MTTPAAKEAPWGGVGEAVVTLLPWASTRPKIQPIFERRTDDRQISSANPAQVAPQPTATERAEQQLHSTMQKYAATLTELAGIRERLILESTHDLLELAFSIGKELAQKELSVSSEATLAVVRDLTRDFATSRKLEVRVPEKDYRYLRDHLKPDEASKLSLISDPSLPLGGCFVETDDVSVDASFEQRAKSIRAALALSGSGK